MAEGGADSDVELDQAESWPEDDEVLALALCVL